MGTTNMTTNLHSLCRARNYQFPKGFISRKCAVSQVLAFSTEVENARKTCLELRHLHSPESKKNVSLLHQATANRHHTQNISGWDRA